jgi:hypothetical protein
MSWQNEMVRIVRYLVNDLTAATYSDSRLEETILVAAQLQYASIDFDNTYTIDVDTLTLTPDPTTSPKDDWFINIICTKTASIILNSEAKTLAAQAYRIKDGPSSIEVKGAYDAVKEMADDLDEKLEKMIMDYKIGEGIGGHAIFTPYTQERISDGNPLRNFQ